MRIKYAKKLSLFCYVALKNSVGESEVKRPTPTFPKFPTPTPYHEMSKVWLSTIL